MSAHESKDRHGPARNAPSASEVSLVSLGNGLRWTNFPTLHVRKPLLIDSQSLHVRGGQLAEMSSKVGDKKTPTPAMGKILLRQLTCRVLGNESD